MTHRISFEAIVKEVKSRALVSGDKSYRILLETQDPMAVEAAVLRGDETYRVEIMAEGKETDNGKEETQ